MPHPRPTKETPRRSFMDTDPVNWRRRNAIEIQAKDTYSVFIAGRPEQPAWERLTEAKREAWRNVASIPPVLRCPDPDCNGELQCRQCRAICP